MKGFFHRTPKWLWLALGATAVALACVALAAWLSPPLAAPAPSPELLKAGSGLDTIVIEAAFDPARRVLEASQRMTLANRTGAEQHSLALRTWPNAFQSVETSPCASEELYDQCYPDGFSAGSLVMREALAAISGAIPTSVAYRYTDAAKTALSLPLPDAWPPLATAEITLRYTVNIPRAAYRFGEQNGIWALGNAFAIPAVYEDGAYRTDEYSMVGDPFISDCANYEVALTVPPGWHCAASAVPETVNEDGKLVYRFELPAARDFALVLSERFQTAESMEGGVLVRACASSRSAANEMLRYARRALQCFQERYGAYPYPALTLAEIDFPMGGMEYPGMAMISSAMLQAGCKELEYAVAHEVAHQWWYAVVGSDSVNQAWQDEALCEFSLLDYVETAYGRAARDELEQRRVESAMRVTIPRGVTPGAPLSYFSGMSEYALVVYNRGAAMLCALDRMMGGGLDGFLARYYNRYAFERATRADFEALLAEYTGEDYAPLIVDYLDTSLMN